MAQPSENPHLDPYSQRAYQQQPQYAQPLPSQYQPQYGQPQYGQPQYGQPQYGQPQYGQPQYGQPQYGQQPQYQPYAQPQPQYSTQPQSGYPQPTSDQQSVTGYRSEPSTGVKARRQSTEPLTTELIKDGRFNYKEGECRDILWLILFIVHLIIIVLLAGVYGKRMVDDSKNATSDNTTPAPNTGSSISTHDQNNVIAILSVSAVIAAVFGALWLEIMKRCADSLIKVSMIISCTFLGIAAIASFAAGIVVMGVIYLIILILQVVYFYLVRNRIPFAQATLGASTQAIQDYNGPIYVAYLMAILSIAWTAFWSFTLIAIIHSTAMNNGNFDTGNGQTNSNNSNSSNGINGVAYFCLLVSFYWTFQVLKNIGHVTTAGVVGTWWFNPHATSATWGAFKRATTTSLGSICFGSLIVALLQATRQILREAQQRAANDGNAGAAFVACCIGCLLGWIEGLIRYFNMYAYTRVAIYGLGYWQAATETWDLFVRRGFEQIVNDDLTGMVLTMGCIMGGVVTGLFGAFWANALGFDGWVVVGIIAFLIGFILVALIMNVIESAVATTFVVWAEDPATINTTRPEQYAKIRDAANQAYPGGQW